MKSLNSLSKNISLVFSTILITILFTGAVAMLYQQRQSIETSLKESLQTHAKSAATSLAFWVKIYNIHGIQRTLSDSYLSSHTEFLTISDLNHKVLFAIPEGKSPIAADCPFRFEEAPIEIYQEKLGTLSYCYNLKKLAQTNFFYIPLICFFLAVLAISAIGFFWLKVRASSLERFMDAIDKLETENPHVPPVPFQDRSNPLIVSLYNKLSQLISRLQQALSELLEKNRQEAKHDIAMQVAHDIRSPLSALNVCIEDITPLIPQERSSVLLEVSRRIQSIANDLLAKPTATLNQKPFYLSELISNVVSEKQLQYRSRGGVTLSSKVDPSLEGKAFPISEPHIQRILSNLIDNSAQAINERGTIAISLKDDGNQIHIVVSDTGKGIPKDVLPRLATKNFTFEKKGGTGLGLYDAKLWVEKKGGNMKIESQVNSGTTLTLTLPKENL